MITNCIKCGAPPAFPSAVTEPYTCLTCQSLKAPPEERIKAAFPEMEPSAGHDYVDELIGLLRVARMHIEDAENRRLLSDQRHDAVTTMLSRYLVASKGSVAVSWLDSFIECKAVTLDTSYPTGFIAPVLHLPEIKHQQI